MMRRRTFCFLVATLLAPGLGIRLCKAEPANSLALIVNKTTVILSLSSNDLRAIFLGEKDHWPNGQRVVPVTLAMGTPELKAFLRQVYGMSEGDYKKYFIQANFTGKTLNLPRMAGTPAALKTMVNATPGAIGFVRASDLDNSVGVVRLNGSGPTDPGYKLSMSQ